MWYIPQNIPKILFKDGGESSIVSDCTREQKINFEGFPENGCYGNQPQPLEVLFDSINCLFDSINCNNTVTNPALSQNKILFSNKHVLYVSVSFYTINYSFDTELLLSVLFTGFIWK